jgi:ribosomal protein S18 acetylase RimI-like enzyme
MELTLCELVAAHLKDVNSCDNTFTVDAKLVLDAENGVISYEVVSVSPYEKRYPLDELDVATYIANPDRIIYLAYLDGQLAGQIRIGKWWNRFAYIEDIVVHSPFRKQGVGRALIGQAITWAKAGGYPGIMLETQNINVGGCRLYESCGFKLGGFDTCLYKGIHPDKDEIALYWYLIF